MTLMNIELRKLQHVAVLARTASFVRAAQALNITQSALTRSIQALEARYAIRLFDRDRSGVRLTAVGREFLKRAQPLLNEAEDLTRFLQRTGKGEIGQVIFGLSTLPAKLFLAPLVLHLFKAKQGLHCSVAVRHPDELLDMLENDKIEFFLASTVPAGRAGSLEITELAEICTTFMVREGHPLLDRSTLSFADITPYPILVSQFEPSSGGPIDFMDAHANTLLSDDYSSLMQVALGSDAIWITAILPAIDAGTPSNLMRLPLSYPSAAARVTLKSVKRARRTLSRAAAEVLDELQALCRGTSLPSPLAGDMSGRQGDSELDRGQQS
jgi:DNA-binding transcriptional LysR family regulator